MHGSHGMAYWRVGSRCSRMSNLNLIAVMSLIPGSWRPHHRGEGRACCSSDLAHTPCCVVACRALPSLILNFMDESGSLSDAIDLAYHRRENHQHITNAVVQELSDLIPSITSLNLEDCFEVTDTGLWYVTTPAPPRTGPVTNGQHLKLHATRARHKGQQSATLKPYNRVPCCFSCVFLFAGWVVPVVLMVTRALSRSCTRLRDLNLRGMPSVTAKGLRDIALACKSLKRLNLAQCAAVDDAAITTIAANLWGLEELDLSGE